MVKLLSLFFAFLTLFLIFPTALKAQDVEGIKSGVDLDTALRTLSATRWIPGDPLYFLVSLKENLQTTFQPNTERRAQWEIILSGKRMKEAYLLAQKSKTDQATESLKKYEATISQAIVDIDKSAKEGRNVTWLVDLLSDNLRYHETVIDGIITKTPEAARAGLSQGIEVSSRGLQKAVEEVQKIKPADKTQPKSQGAEPASISTPSVIQ